MGQTCVCHLPTQKSCPDTQNQRIRPYFLGPKCRSRYSASIGPVHVPKFGFDEDDRRPTPTTITAVCSLSRKSINTKESQTGSPRAQPAWFRLPTQKGGLDTQNRRIRPYFLGRKCRSHSPESFGPVLAPKFAPRPPLNRILLQ